MVRALQLTSVRQRITTYAGVAWALFHVRLRSALASKRPTTVQSTCLFFVTMTAELLRPMKTAYQSRKTDHQTHQSSSQPMISTRHSTVAHKAPRSVAQTSITTNVEPCPTLRQHRFSQRHVPQAYHTSQT